MKKFSLFAVAFVLFGLALHADNIVDEIIARVNDQIITRSDYEKAKAAQLDELKQRFPADWQSKWTEAQKEILRDLIDQQLLMEKGKELGITGETEVVKRLNQMRQQMGLASMDDLEKEAKKQGVSFEDYKEQIRINVVTQQVIGQEVGGKIHITEEEVQDFYKQHQKELEGPEEVNLSEIMISTQPPKPEADSDKDKDSAAQDKLLPEDPTKVAEAEKKAEEAEKALKAGAKFEDLARKVSDGATAGQGGPLGSFKRGELAKELEDKTFSLKPGEFTEPLRTKQGFIILKVNGHRSAGVPPLKEVEDKIREAIYSQKLEPAARAYLGKLRDQAYIDVKPGFVDLGATAGQGNKPVMLAAAGDASNKQGQSGLKKKKRFLLF
ncbi:MAG TPA: peptidylprolyl isomerase [Candidatus Angelobacter sp.]|nr:peptidylprolyl isomerase [Candidatus Angelobacter sp.]